MVYTPQIYVRTIPTYIWGYFIPFAKWDNILNTSPRWYNPIIYIYIHIYTRNIPAGLYGFTVYRLLNKWIKCLPRIPRQSAGRASGHGGTRLVLRVPSLLRFLGTAPGIFFGRAGWVKGWISIRENMWNRFFQNVSDFLNDVSLMEFVIDVWTNWVFVWTIVWWFVWVIRFNIFKTIFLGMDVLSS